MVALCVVGLALFSACAPPAITKTGEQVGSLYNIVLVMATVVFVGVEAAIIYSAIRYRRRHGDDSLPEQFHGNTRIEVVWTVIPSVIVMALFVMSMKVLADVNHEQPSPLTVRVTGFQWQWKFDYFKGPDDDHLTSLGVSVVAAGQTSPPTLVLPVGERIHFQLESSDVIHSFYVPAWLFKRDVVPGRTNTFDITIDPTKIGRYEGQCAELCGDFHNEMTFQLQTMTSADFQRWIADEARKQAKLTTCSPSGTSLQISAQNTAFDTRCLAAPANQPFTIAFVNKDAGVPHNVEIFTNQSATERLGGATGPTDLVTGPATVTYEVPALKPGNYYFHCDVHPGMNGAFVVK